MSRKIEVIPLLIGIYLLTLIFCPITYAVDGVRDNNGEPRYNGHKCETGIGTPLKQVCANCHKPHGGKGNKIWGRGWSPNKTNKETKVKDLCESCHYLPNNDFKKISSGLKQVHYIRQYVEGGTLVKKDTTGYGNVFRTDGYSHVMGEQVEGLHTQDKADVPDVFPVNAEEGFYCGSCHNPHKQPKDSTGIPDETGNGDYLRVENIDKPGSAGLAHDRTQFCIQCHRNAPHALKALKNANTCEYCHYPPHSGKPEGLGFGRGPELLLFVDSNPNPDDSMSRIRYARLSIVSEGYWSEGCVFCHCNNDNYSKDIQIRGDHGNHPLGRKWADTSCAVSGCHSKSDIPATNIFRLDGYQQLKTPFWQQPPLPISQQKFYCISCHLDHDTSYEDPSIKDNPTIQANPSYLLYANFKDDNTAYCEHCHGACKASLKSASLLMASNGTSKGLHFKTINDPDNPSIGNKKRGGCMFCHFIHLDQNDPRDVPKFAWADDKQGTVVRADINALMRVPPKALDWGDQGGGISSISDPTARYEAMCYGCHGDPAIVGPYGENGGKGSLLKPAGRGFFSHRFACAPSSANTKANTSRVIKDGKFPLADGTPGAAGGVMDDYGTVAGEFYCGSCHDVHSNQKPPYLYKLSSSDVASPYMSDSTDSIDVKVTPQDSKDGFCEQCHCTPNNPDPKAEGTTHPVGDKAIPDTSKTARDFPVEFSGRDKLEGNGGGSQYGLTYLNRGSRGGVICLTCHGVHAASTSWNGMVNSGSTKDNHGKLLVKDNFLKDTGIGSDMCGGCHDEFFK